MILYMALVFAFNPAWSQEGPAERFNAFCSQLSVPGPAEQIRPNPKIGNLMAVVDAAQETPKLIREALARQLTFEEFKAESAGKGVKINDHFHQEAYFAAARVKCDATVTESGTLAAGTEAHNAPTREQYTRRINDVDPSTGSPGSSTGTTSEGTQ